MHRTLFTPSMVETYRICKRAYGIAFANYDEKSFCLTRASLICKRYLMRALSEINRGKIVNIHQVRKHMGQRWPVNELTEEVVDPQNATKAFLFAYKTLAKYVFQPYKPDGAQIVAAALKVRARIASVRIYIEDTFDLILWDPKKEHLEIVEFQLQPIKKSDPFWPTPSQLIKQYLAERLKSRWPFKKLLLTQFKLGAEVFESATTVLEEPMFTVHWPEILKTLDEMKTSDGLSHTYMPNHDEHCHPCKILDSKLAGRYINEPSHPLEVFQLTA